MRKPVILMTQMFDSRQEAREHFRAMLRRYKPGERLNDDDTQDLAGLLRRHTEYHDKVGCGISHFEVMLNEHGTVGFYLVRTDGSGTDFSFIHCINNRPPSLKQEVHEAFRNAIQPEILRMRDDFQRQHRTTDGLFVCAVSNERIPFHRGSIDHRPPMTFEVIVETFLAAHRMTLDQVPLTEKQDNQIATELTDDRIKEQFIEYHNKVARLDFIKRSINSAQSAEHRLKPTRMQAFHE